MPGIRKRGSCSTRIGYLPFTIRLQGVARCRWRRSALGLEAHASDLNPVAVLINKAMIEIPPRFAGQGASQSGRTSGWAVKRSRRWSSVRMEGSAGAGGGRPLLRPVDA